jgi:hypothetical protein
MCCQSGPGLTLANAMGLPNVAWVGQNQSTASIVFALRYGF